LRIVEELQSKLSDRNKRIQFLESILREKVPNFQLIDTLANAKDDLMEDMEPVDLKVKLEAALAKISELENSIANNSLVSNPVTPVKNMPRSLDKIGSPEDYLPSALTLTATVQKVAPGERVADIVRKRLEEIEAITPTLSQDLVGVVDKLEQDNQTLQTKISKLKAKFTAFITEFKKTSVKDLESLANVHKQLISKAVQEDKDDSSVLNVDLIKILSFLHIDNRRLKGEIKNLKQEFKEKQDEWADQREKLRENLDTYGDKVNRLQKILNKFLVLHNRELDPIPGSKSTSSGGRVLDWKLFTDSITTKDDEEASMMLQDVSHEFRFQNTKKTIKGNKKSSLK
jgi:hypothetical protein